MSFLSTRGQSINAISNTNTLGSLITTGGNVGIGTTSPAYKLDVNGLIQNTNNNVKTITLTKYVSVATNTTTSFTFDITNDLGLTTASTVYIELAGSFYRVAGRGTSIFRFNAGGFAGHNNVSYHPAGTISNYTSGGGSVTYINNSPGVYGVTISNTSDQDGSGVLTFTATVKLN